MSRPYNNCTEISPACPIEGTLYGYYPNKPANGAYAIIFVVCLVAQLILGIRYKTKSYAIALSLGCLIEVAGKAFIALAQQSMYLLTSSQAMLVESSFPRILGRGPLCQCNWSHLSLHR
jgi:hypothetical protein